MHLQHFIPAINPQNMHSYPSPLWFWLFWLAPAESSAGCCWQTSAVPRWLFPQRQPRRRPQRWQMRLWTGCWHWTLATWPLTLSSSLTWESSGSSWQWEAWVKTRGRGDNNGSFIMSHFIPVDVISASLGTGGEPRPDSLTLQCPLSFVLSCFAVCMSCLWFVRQQLEVWHAGLWEIVGQSAEVPEPPGCHRHPVSSWLLTGGTAGAHAPLCRSRGLAEPDSPRWDRLFIPTVEFSSSNKKSSVCSSHRAPVSLWRFCWKCQRRASDSPQKQNS